LYFNIKGLPYKNIDLTLIFYMSGNSIYMISQPFTILYIYDLN